MYRVLIIDDEPFICKGLSELIDWTSLGCTICGTAMNGFDGEKLINKLNPDIVVSDIVMPGKTGLELADFVNRNHKGIIMILLSGYDEFTYAKEAIKYGVFDYLLKPTDKDEVMSVIRKAVKKIEQTRVIEKNYEDMEVVLQESLPIIEQSLLHDIVIDGVVNNHHIGNLRLNQGKGAVITVQGYNDILDNQTFEKVTDLIEQLFKSKNVTTRIITNSNEIIILPTFSPKIPNKVIETRLQMLSENILDSFLYKNKDSFSIGIGGLYTSIDSIHASYLQSLNAISKSFFVGKGKVHLYEEVIVGNGTNEFSARLMRFIDSFEEWDVNKTEKQFDTVFKELKVLNNKQMVINHSLELLIKLGFIATKWDKEYSMYVGYEQLEKCKTFDELEQFMKETCLEIKKHLYETMNKNNLGIVKQAKQIIEFQYSNPDLSAQYIADQLKVNVSYLSRLFKKETGKNLSNFVTEKRIQMAQKLFETTDFKANEVATKVGYTDPRYFSQVFKKVVKITPSNFKRGK
ncbi:response regulator [Bacillus sp. JJ1533]|uniref:response regulator n=1 Tax=Bacillus sp. JJ1533 TaxID=3122959 RepID=UPI0030006152